MGVKIIAYEFWKIEITRVEIQEAKHLPVSDR